MEGTNLGIEARIPIAAKVVILNHIFERGDAAVVHIRRGARDLAQRGSLEVALARAQIGEFAVAPGDAGVVQSLVSESWTNMTRAAVSLTAEHGQAGFLEIAERVEVADHKVVIAGTAGPNAAHETVHSTCHLVGLE